MSAARKKLLYCSVVLVVMFIVCTKAAKRRVPPPTKDFHSTTPKRSFVVYSLSIVRVARINYHGPGGMVHIHSE